jgi:hypothetical protein
VRRDIHIPYQHRTGWNVRKRLYHREKGISTFLSAQNRWNVRERGVPPWKGISPFFFYERNQRELT